MSQGFALGWYGLPLQGSLGMMLAAWRLGGCLGMMLARWHSVSSPGCDALLRRPRGFQEDGPLPTRQSATAHAEFARLAVIPQNSSTEKEDSPEGAKPRRSNHDDTTDTTGTKTDMGGQDGDHGSFGKSPVLPSDAAQACSPAFAGFSHVFQEAIVHG